MDVLLLCGPLCNDRSGMAHLRSHMSMSTGYPRVLIAHGTLQSRHARSWQLGDGPELVGEDGALVAVSPGLF